MAQLFAQLTTTRLKESSYALFNRPIEEEDPFRINAEVIGMIKDCHESSVCFSYY